MQGQCYCIMMSALRFTVPNAQQNGDSETEKENIKFTIESAQRIPSETLGEKKETN